MDAGPRLSPRASRAASRPPSESVGAARLRRFAWARFDRAKVRFKTLAVTFVLPLGAMVIDFTPCRRLGIATRRELRGVPHAGAEA